jgi:hypothetical protein
VLNKKQILRILLGVLIAPAWIMLGLVPAFFISVMNFVCDGEWEFPPRIR